MVNLTWFLVSNIKHILILSKKVFKLFLIGPQKIFWQNSTLIRRLNVRRICLTSNIKLFLIGQHEGFPDLKYKTLSDWTTWRILPDLKYKTFSDWTTWRILPDLKNKTLSDWSTWRILPDLKYKTHSDWPRLMPQVDIGINYRFEINCLRIPSPVYLGVPHWASYAPPQETTLSSPPLSLYNPPLISNFKCMYITSTYLWKVNIIYITPYTHMHFTVKLQTKLYISLYVFPEFVFKFNFWFSLA